ncbi:Uncharacterized protein Adt_05040 [Abeliophyllum distichum]|uniref:ATP synthase F0 subunit 8 n=1 Tax=Abeliophyllum distichum TaxID=126358 RepID=A0ABD1V2Z5_9LAMI
MPSQVSLSEPPSSWWLIFILSGIFSCFYHWEKIRSLRRAAFAADVDLEADNSLAPSKPKPTHMNQSLPVLMPGDHIPKFIALPCPCQPPLPGRIIVQVQKLPLPRQLPPRVAVT